MHGANMKILRISCTSSQQNIKFTFHQFDTVSTFSDFHSTIHATEQCVFQKGSISSHGCTLSTSTCLFCLSHSRLHLKQHKKLLWKRPEVETCTQTSHMKISGICNETRKQQIMKRDAIFKQLKIYSQFNCFVHMQLSTHHSEWTKLNLQIKLQWLFLLIPSNPLSIHPT